MLPTITESTKHSWQDEIRFALKNQNEISSFFNLPTKTKNLYQSFIPRNFAYKILNSSKDSPLRKQFLPSNLENSNIGLIDPIGDKVHSKNDGIIHRYKNRILFTPTTKCPIICRYCFRKNELNENDEIYKINLNKLELYLEQDDNIDEVILTGGDPLFLSNNKLATIFSLIAKKNIKFLRIHTRTPIVIPSRIDNEFIQLIKKFETKFQRIIFTLHTNHADEIDEEVKSSLLKLKQCRIDKKTQTVLLKSINNDFTTLKNLIYRVLDCDFTPYYLHHPDKVLGAMHFFIKLEEGRKIYNQLRNEIPGWAIPHYVIDNFQGKGKQLAFNPESFQYGGKLIDKSGQLAEY